MRTTIELSESQRAELLKLAAQRGHKGFSALIKEALDYYLETVGHKKSKIEKALKQMGSFHGKDADLFEAEVLKMRKHWR